MLVRHFVAALMLITLASGRTAAQAVIEGIDHIPVAVKDLEQSEADYEALGFALKPGRLHKNGLRNTHVNFPDGTEIELITSPAATDALSTEYYNWLKGGDGPAFLGIYAPDFAPLAQRLSQSGLAVEVHGSLATFAEPKALRRLFFARRQHSPTDRQEHFNHENTAFSLAGVWIAGGAAERQLLQSLGAAHVEERRCGPPGSSSQVLTMSDGEIVFLPATAELLPRRSILGLTVMVRRIGTARRVLADNQVPYRQPAGCNSRSLWVDPTVAHGAWIEFRPTSRGQ